MEQSAMKILNGIFTISALALNLNAMADVVVDIPANPTDVVMCDYSTLHAHAGDSVVLEAVFEPISVSCPAGKYLSKTTARCETCPEGYVCQGSGDGEFVFSEDVELGVGITKCPDNAPMAPAGSTKLGDCGHILRVGGKQMYVHQDTNTPKPRLAVHVNGETFYAPMTTESVKMSKDSNAKLHIKIEEKNYTVHDNSVSE